MSIYIFVNTTKWNISSTYVDISAAYVNISIPKSCRLRKCVEERKKIHIDVE